MRGGFIQKKKRLGKKKEERIHAWISNFTAEHLEEIAGLGKKKKKKNEVFFSFLIICEL